MWYALAVAVVMAAALVNSGLDRWLTVQPTPWGLKATLVVAMRWAFWCSVPVYAWLIDSFREPYSEPAIWAFFAVGIVLVTVLALVTHKAR